MNRLDRSKPLVLITDDDSALLMLLKVAMGQEGFDVVQAGSGEQCLQDYLRLHPDMVLLDAMMPGMDGFECCRQLRQLPGGENLPILMITVLDKPEYVDRAFEAGATDYITKPIYWAVLSHRVRRLLATYQNAQQAESARRALARHRAWIEIQRQCLQNLQARSLAEFLESSLQELCQFLGSDRCLLYQCSTQSWLEATAQTTAQTQDLTPLSLEGLSVAGLDEIPNWLSEPIATSNNADCAENQPLQALCEALQVRALQICPVPLTGNLQAILFAGHQQERDWSELERGSLQDISELVAIALRLQKQG